MDGNGEGLVAFVQGLDTPEVTLTVCSRPRQHQDRRRSSRIQLNPTNTSQSPVRQKENTMSARPVIQRSSAETSTACEKTDCVKSSTGAQICDGRYTSSYKLAHCMVTPTSPPEAVSEFPPQRKEPCRNQGNFEIGQQWNGQDSRRDSGYSGSPVRVSTSRTRHYRASQLSGEKGSVHCRGSYRDMEAFAQTLRKYPSSTPYRTASTDLIEKIIRYTQAKNSQEASLSTKSMRCLQQQKSSEANDMSGRCKQQQTYTRRQDHDVPDNCKERTRNYKLYSAIDSRNIKDCRLKESAYSSSYDYLKAGNSRHGRSYHSDGSPSPKGSRSPSDSRSPSGSISPVRSRSPVRLRSPDRSKSHRSSRPERPGRCGQLVSPVRDPSLSDVSKYLRSITIKQICNKNPLVFQVCPNLKNRYNQHKKICPNKSKRSSDSFENDTEGQASGSILSRLMTTLSGCASPSSTRNKCQCIKADCRCSKSTQCALSPEDSPNKVVCNCISSASNLSHTPCTCSGKYHAQEYYNKRIDEEISEWIQDVPVHNVEGPKIKKKRESIIKELRKTLKELPDNESFVENATNEINKLVDDFPMWIPGTDKEDDKLFRNQLANKLTNKILSIPRTSDRFKDIVKKWIANIGLEDDDEGIDVEVITNNIVNKLKSLAAHRPVCDTTYTRMLNYAIIDLLEELSLFDGDTETLVKMANTLSAEIVTIPRNVDLLSEPDMTSEFKDIVADWICEHGLCKELKEDPKLIIGLANKLKSLKTQDINDNIMEEMHQFEDDVSLAFKTIDELIEELMKQNTVKTKGRLNQSELIEVINDWLRNIPGITDLHPREFHNVTNELVQVIQEGYAQENDNLGNDIVDCLDVADPSIDPDELTEKVEELLNKLNILPSNIFYKEQAERKLLKETIEIIDRLPISEHKKEDMKNKARAVVHENINRSTSKFEDKNVQKALLDDMGGVISDTDMLKQSRSNLNTLFDSSDLKQVIAKDIKSVVNELPIDMRKKKNLMQQVKGTLSKKMDKPLPNNVKNTINDEISDIVEKCPISKDRGIASRLKKLLSAVASHHLNMFLPKVKCVCDIQRIIENDISIVIDKSPIDACKKRDLKKCIRDILIENEDCRLSDEVVKTIQKEISCAISDLSIPEDKKGILKHVFGETVSKDVDEASATLKHDLNKIRNKLLDDTINVIQKCPISNDVKSQLINKLNFMLARNLDSSLSDEEKNLIIEDVSDIFKDTMPEEKRRQLENNMAKNLNTESEEKQESLTEIINSSLNDTLRDKEQVIDKAPIPEEKKNQLKKKLRETANKHFKIPLADDLQDAFNNDINEIVDELNLPKDKTDKLKDELTRKDKNIRNLQKKIKDLETTRRRKTSRQGLMPIKEVNETKGRSSKEVKTEINGRKSSSSTITGSLSPKEAMKHEIGETIKARPLSPNVATKHEVKENIKGGPLSPKEAMKHEVGETIKARPLSPKEATKHEVKESIKAHPVSPKEVMKSEVKESIKAGPLSPKEVMKHEVKESIKTRPVSPKEAMKHEGKEGTKARPLSSKEATKHEGKESIKTGPLNPKEATKHEGKVSIKALSPKEAKETIKAGSLSPKEAMKSEGKESIKARPLSPKKAMEHEEKEGIKAGPLSPKEPMKHEVKKTNKAGPLSPKEPKETIEAGPLSPKETMKSEVKKTIETGSLSLKEAMKQELKKNMKQSRLQEEKRNKLANDITKVLNILLTEDDDSTDEEIGRDRKKAVEKEIRDICDKYGIDPSYENQLAEEFNNIVDMALKGGDLEDAKRKFIKKIMQDLDLSEEEATALANEVIGRGRKIAIKDDIKDIFEQYGIDPCYENQLAEEFNNIVDIASIGRDLQNARRKLIENIMRDTNLLEEEATALAMEMIGRARKIAIKADIKDILRKYGIDPSYEKQLTEELNNLLEIELRHGDLEDATKALIEKLLRDTYLSEEAATALFDELIGRARDIILAAKAKDSCAVSILYEKPISEAISGFIDRSTLPDSDKNSVKDNLLMILKETLKQSGVINKNENGALKDKILTECNNIVDETSIPTDKKNQLKLALKEDITNCIKEINKMLAENNDDDTDFAVYKDKVKECIETYMDKQSIKLDSTILEALVKDFATDLIDRQKYLNAHPEIKISEKDEMENFNYQVFRRAKKHAGLKTTLQIMKDIGELYKMIMALGLPLSSPKFRPLSLRG